jgi:hypothetical protein
LIETCTILVGLKTDSFYPVPFRPFFYIMLLFPFLPNYKKLSYSINFNFILHDFVVAYFHKCGKISFRSDHFSTFVILCSTFFDLFHPYILAMSRWNSCCIFVVYKCNVWWVFHIFPIYHFAIKVCMHVQANQSIFPVYHFAITVI